LSFLPVSLAKSLKVSVFPVPAGPYKLTKLVSEATHIVYTLLEAHV